MSADTAHVSTWPQLMSADTAPGQKCRLQHLRTAHRALCVLWESMRRFAQAAATHDIGMTSSSDSDDYETPYVTAEEEEAAE